MHGLRSIQSVNEGWKENNCIMWPWIFLLLIVLVGRLQTPSDFQFFYSWLCLCIIIDLVWFKDSFLRVIRGAQLWPIWFLNFALVLKGWQISGTLGYYCSLNTGPSNAVYTLILKAQCQWHLAISLDCFTVHQTLLYGSLKRSG